MTSINISVKKDAYDFLKKLKSKDQSFSDVILSFKKDKNVIMDFFGILKNLDWNMREDCMKDMRRSFDKRL
ncbi:MAG: antitoxin VapB family protein [Nanoarchaeota archaeon]|nr:antitoxin VapB family protein [Nanoarchaeota archaeon]